MTEGEQKPIEEKDFELRLSNSDQEVQSRYYDLLAKERVRRTKEKKGRPEPVSLVDREEMLKRAGVLASGEKLYGIDSLKQEEVWESYKIPPNRGAKDD